MDLGRKTAFLSFAILGFIIGAVAYTFLHWLASGISNLTAVYEVVRSGWFLSGIAGSLLVIGIIYILSSTKR